MTIIDREFNLETDYQRVRDLLVESYAINKNLHNWGLDRWDACRFGGYHQGELTGRRDWIPNVHLWQTETGKLAGVAHPENPGSLFFEIHPNYRHVEPEMLAWAEANHRTNKPADAETWPLNLYIDDDDTARIDLLARNGYADRGPCGRTRHRSMRDPIGSVVLPQGYTVRLLNLTNKTDLINLAETQNLTFGHTCWTAETVRVIAQSPTYRADLDLVVEAPGGSIAAFCTLWVDEANRIAVFEPVGTHPDHRRLGLAKAMMNSGLHRLAGLGITDVYLGCGYAADSNYLYLSVGFTHSTVQHHWQKDLAQ